MSQLVDPISIHQLFVHHLARLVLVGVFVCMGGMTNAGPPVYETRDEHDPNGIGKFYMGREIAHVMGHQGIPWLERDTREQEERLSKLVDILNVKPGDNVADIGAGSGVITMMMARKTAPSGTVYAVDIQPEMLAAIETKLEKAEIDNVELVLGTIKSPKLPANSCDLAFMVDVYHEFNFPHEMLTGIVAGLKPGGRIAFVEYRKEDPTIRIKEVHKMTEAQVKKEALQKEFGLRHVTTNEDLPLQHVVIFEKMEEKRDAVEGQTGKRETGKRETGEAKEGDGSSKKPAGGELESL